MLHVMATTVASATRNGLVCDSRNERAEVITASQG
jgi:hypothetical protein